MSISGISPELSRIIYKYYDDLFAQSDGHLKEDFSIIAYFPKRRGRCGKKTLKNRRKTGEGGKGEISGRANGLAESAEIKGAAVGGNALDGESAPGARKPLPAVDGVMLLVASRRSVFLAVGVDCGATGGDCRRKEGF
jgi:hypothetical protein